MKTVYLDHAATTKMLPEVIEAMMKSYENDFGNPSSTHRIGQKSRAIIEKARKIVAEILDVDTQEIIFTSGGAEGNNLLIRGILNANKDKGNHIITTKIEHSSVLKTFQQLENEGYEVTYLDVDKNGMVNVEQLKNSLRENTTLVSVMYVNNETGVKQPIKEIGEILEEKGIFFHTDAVQAIGKEIINPKELKIGALTAASHKFHGPKGSGFAFLDKKIQIEKEIWGGAQERNRRAGTENVQGILGTGIALEKIYKNIDEIQKNEKEVHEYLEKRLKDEISDIKINGENAKRVETITNITAKGCDIQTLLIGLDMRGIFISGGSACMSGAQEPSHVLKAMGLSVDELNSSFRVSICKDTTKDEIDYFVENLKEIVEIERK